jgi:hypothetical protein
MELPGIPEVYPARTWFFHPCCVIMKLYKGGVCMRCEFKDGMTIDYSGSLRVRTGKDIMGVLVKEDGLPDTFKYVLDSAARNHDCSELRKITEEITRTDCGRVCMH